MGQRDVIYPAKSSGDGSGASIVCLLPHNLRACANRKDSDQPPTLTTTEIKGYLEDFRGLAAALSLLYARIETRNPGPTTGFRDMSYKQCLTHRSLLKVKSQAVVWIMVAFFIAFIPKSSWIVFTPFLGSKKHS